MNRREAIRALVGLTCSPGLLLGLRAPRAPSAHLRFMRRDYPAFDAVEWQVRVRAPAGGTVPLFENPLSADFVLEFSHGAPVVLHWSKGSHGEPSDFEPRQEALERGKVTLESFGGRSSDGAMPYFNVAARGEGLIFAIGWSGDWKATFEALGDGKVHITAGLKRARFRLHPGEEVRLPSVLVLRYRGDWLDGQNRFRRLMLREFTPASHPPMMLMPVAASVHGIIRFNDTTEEKLSALAADLAAKNLPLDTFWLDAGWNERGFPLGQGNPDADPERFPRGLAPVGQAARKAGMRFLAWFEPERVMRGTWLDRECSQWLLRPSATPPELRYLEKAGFRLLDLGNPKARRWVLDSVSRHIRDAGIAIYRQDCNLYPAYFWHTAEDPESVGLREIRHIGGLYEYLDELAQRHSGLIIDNCASGGRRLDFEMMRRSVPLWRSDSDWLHPSYPRNAQAMTHGLSLWLPLHGLGADSMDEVALRSGMGACASFAINFRDATAVEALRTHLARYLAVRDLFAADYFPLTPWSLDPARWLAFQFHDPVSQRGIVQAFCGGARSAPRVHLKLRGLEPAVRYAVRSWDSPEEVRLLSGRELMSEGLTVIATRDKEALVFEYSSDNVK